MKKRKIEKMFLILFFCIGNIFWSFSLSNEIDQVNVRVTGQVTDSNGEFLIGVNVIEVGTTNGTVTDFNGNYSIDLTTQNPALSFTYVGFLPVEISVGSDRVINVVLEEDIETLDELVVVGYGVQKKVTLTGSVSSIQGEKIEESPAISLSNSLSGRIPGVIALNRSGEPGQDNAQLLIRGQGTLGSTAPLIVIDGVTERGGLDQIDPTDIESISVLKDASAAIYGSRAANGAIIITTKRGKAGNPTIKYGFNQGFVQPTRVPEFADAVLLAEFQNEQLIAGGQSPRFTQEEINLFRNGSDPINYPNTDWIKSTIKNFSTQSRHNLSVQGGNESASYYMSGNFSNQNNIFKNGISNSKVLSVRSNLDVNITDNLTTSLDLSFQQTNNLHPSSGLGSIIGNIYRNYPYLVDVYPNGLPGAGYIDNSNPQVQVTDAEGYRRNKINLYQTKVTFNLEIPYIEGLVLNSFIAYDKNHNENKNFRKPYKTYRYNAATDDYIEYTAEGFKAPELTEIYDARTSLLFNTKLSYTKTIGNHSFDAFAAIEQSEVSFKNFSGFRKNFISSEIDQLFAGGEAEQIADGVESEFARRNYFGRLSYNYLEKYLIDLNIRYDGSSAFPKDKRWGFFPGISVGWRLSQEPFMANLSDVISNLKLRASWGQMGNDAILPFQYLAKYSFVQGYIFGNPKYLATGLKPGVEPNPNITWEVSNSSNIALDANLLNGLFDMTLDFFKTRRSDILTERNASVPLYTGLNLPLENIGIVENNGFDFSVIHRKNFNELNYAIGGNFTFARNKVIDIDEPSTVYPWQSAQGKPIGSQLYYESIGIYRTQEEIDNSPHVNGTRIGDLQYRDVNEDGVISAEDRVRFNGSSIPEIVFGANFYIDYKGFDLSVLFQGQAKSWGYYFLPQGLFGNVIKDMAENRPSIDPNSKYPNLASDESEVSALVSDFWLKNTTFLRLKNVELGYNFDKKITSKLKLNGLRVYLSGFNLFTLDNLGWFDPEGDSDRGAFYPQNKIYNIGINITL